MGVPERYRWDWSWQEPASKPDDLVLNLVGKPPPRRPREEEVPKGKWVMIPALVRDTDDLGNQLRFEPTVLSIQQCDLVLTEPQITEKEMDAEEFEKLKEIILPPKPVAP